MSLFYNELEVRNKMIDVLKNSLISNNGYRSTQQPFFCKDKGNLFEIQINNQDLYKLNIKLSNNLKDRILDYIQSNKYLQDIPLKLNRNIILIYQIFAQPQKEIRQRRDFGSIPEKWGFRNPYRHLFPLK